MRFEKVSFDQYKNACIGCGRSIAGISDDILRKEWEDIKLPVRATSGSAGYDFFMPYEIDVSCAPQSVPTGIRCQIDEGYVLICCPKSGLGCKYHMALDNTIGVIDADYYNSDNEGHIMLKFRTDVPITLSKGQKFAQGVFLPFGITDDDYADGIRNGGFGSTGST